MSAWDFEALKEEVLKDRVARVAYQENNIRRKLAETFEKARQRKGISIRELAKEIGAPVTQVRRLFHEEQGGDLPLSVLLYAADVLGVTLHISGDPE